MLLWKSKFWHVDKVGTAYNIEKDVNWCNHHRKHHGGSLKWKWKLLSHVWLFATPWIIQFSPSVVFDSLQPHALQQARPPCPSPTPGVYSNSCPLSQWCHPTLSSSVVPFSYCLQSFPASDLFKWVTSLHQVTEVLAFQLQHQSFQWTPRTDLL